MRQASRAIIERGDKILVMRRNKFGHEYYNLVGGSVDPGETPEQALVREVKEEANLVVKDFRLVFYDDAGEQYGVQHIYLCKDPGGEAHISEGSGEAQLNREGQNLYFVEWLEKSKFADIEFVSDRLQKAIIEAFEKGYPKKPKVLQ